MNFKVTYNGKTHYDIYFNRNNENYCLSTGNIYGTIDEIVAVATELMESHNFSYADIVDSTTGEIVVSVAAEEDEDSDFDCDDECGFNPYLGLFDFDC